jgi:homopolymeric O-antigen transport system permease protein
VQPEILKGDSDPGAAPATTVPAALPTSLTGTATQVTIIRRSRGLFDLNLPGLWAYRELLFFLIWRDIKVQYKQTLVGLIWVVLQPVATMLIFVLVFGRLAHLPSNNVPYSLFVFAGLLPWNLFSNGLLQVTTSVVGNSGLISKVYFPRLIIPISAVLGGLVSFGVSLVVLALLMMRYRYAPGIQAVTIPFFILVAIASALAAGLWLSMLNVRYRDIQYTVPFLIQAWLFLTPVAYSSSIVPVRYRALMGLNPMTSVVNGFRWSFVGGPPPWDTSFAVSLAMVFIVLLTGIIFFRRTEKTFADMI